MLKVLLAPLGTLWLLLLLLLPREGSLHYGLIPCNACACCEVLFEKCARKFVYQL